MAGATGYVERREVGVSPTRPGPYFALLAPLGCPGMPGA